MPGRLGSHATGFAVDHRQRRPVELTVGRVLYGYSFLWKNKNDHLGLKDMTERDEVTRTINPMVKVQFSVSKKI